MLCTQKTVVVLLRGLDLLARELILGGLTKKQLSDAEAITCNLPHHQTLKHQGVRELSL
jgi:hypothetical protein